MEVIQTTFRIKKNLLRKFRQYCLDNNKSMSKMLVELIEERITNG